MQSSSLCVLSNSVSFALQSLHVRSVNTRFIMIHSCSPYILFLNYFKIKL
jgi:hypothetical protein